MDHLQAALFLQSTKWFEENEKQNALLQETSRWEAQFVHLEFQAGARRCQFSANSKTVKIAGKFKWKMQKG